MNWASVLTAMLSKLVAAEVPFAPQHVGRTDAASIQAQTAMLREWVTAFEAAGIRPEDIDKLNARIVLCCERFPTAAEIARLAAPIRADRLRDAVSAAQLEQLRTPPVQEAGGREALDKVLDRMPQSFKEAIEAGRAKRARLAAEEAKAVPGQAPGFTSAGEAARGMAR